MALIKEEKQKDGNTARYWIIVDFPSNRMSPKGFIRLFGYASKGIRKNTPINEQKKAKCATKKIYVSPQSWKRMYDRVTGGANIYRQLYNYCKQVHTDEQTLEEDPFFADATSDHEDVS